MKSHLLACLLPLLFASCRTLTPANPEEVARVRVACETARTQAYEARQSWVFEFNHHWWQPARQLTALGYAKVDPGTGDYEGVCESTTVGKLFDVMRTNGEINVWLTSAVFGDPQKAGKIIGEDISRLFFDWVPPPEATVCRKGDHLVFRSRHDRDWSEYEFDIVTTRLVGKTICQNSWLSTVTFDEYQRYSCGQYPTVMKLINHKQGYSLTVRNVNIRPAR
ncbi:MAG: hypothetical protein WCS52_09450 [bacterium]